MIIPLHWLREYVQIPRDPHEVAQVLTSLGYMLDGQPKELDGDTILDLEIRQNRSDCLSIIGVARELAAYYKKPLQLPIQRQLISSSLATNKVIVSDPEACYRFNTVLLDIPKQSTTPAWMKKALAAYGMQSINIIVDITNFVMIEYGQPLHAFDMDTLSSSLRVEFADDKEKFVALGANSLTLTKNDLVIRDGNDIVALAGIVGGEKSKVGDQTKTILLEAATYNQAYIRQTSRRHSIRTEASLRHEKFLHPHLTETALQRAVELLVEHTGAIVRSTADTFPHPSRWQSKAISCSYEKIRAYAGTQEITDAMIIDILKSLEFHVAEKSEGTFIATVPYFRTDILIEEDIVEEVIRMYGYDNIPARLPQAAPPKSIQSTIWDISEQVRDIMVAAGYSEQITDPLTHYDNPDKEVIVLENSLTSEKDMLRTTLSNDLIRGVANRAKHRQTDISLFEVGTCYRRKGKEFDETTTLGFIRKYKDASPSVIKGTAELVFERLGYEYDASLVTVSEVNEPSLCYYCEIKLTPLINRKIERRVQVLTSPPQVILQDFSFSVHESTKVGEIRDDIRKLDKTIYEITLGEQPQKLAGEKKSVFFNIVFHDPKRTLTEDDIIPLRKEIISLVEKKYKGEMRGGK